MDENKYLEELIQTARDLTRQLAELQARIDSACAHGQTVKGECVKPSELASWVPPKEPEAPFSPTIPSAQQNRTGCPTTSGQQ